MEGNRYNRNKSQNKNRYHYNKNKSNILNQTIQHKMDITYYHPIIHRQQPITETITIEKSVYHELLRKIEELEKDKQKAKERISIEKLKTRKLRNKNKRLRNKYNKLMKSILINNIPIINGRVVISNNNSNDQEEQFDEDNPYYGEYTIDNGDIDSYESNNFIFQANNNLSYYDEDNYFRDISNEIDSHLNGLIYPVNESFNGNVIHNSERNKERIRKLPIIIYGNLRKPINDKCTICLDNFRDSDEIRKIKCRHLFHKMCIERWLENGNDCPLCKTKLI